MSGNKSIKTFLFVLLSVVFITFGLISAQTTEGKLTFSHKRGFYTAIFDLQISSAVPGAKIRYTLNGKDPFKSSNAREVASPAAITIDPNQTGIHDRAPGVIVTACAVVNGTLASDIVTQTYLFPGKITELSPHNQVPGEGWLIPGSRPQQIQYGLDPRVYNDAAYKSQIEKAFNSIPSVSLVTDLQNLFNPDSGIYVNAIEHSEDWERAASVELLNPDSSEGFQINCGLRIRGAYSRKPENPKHSFRLFFRSKYGKSKLEYPVFGNEGAKEFDLLDIQTAQNYSWSMDGDTRNTFLRELFSRDTQRDMGKPYSRGRFCHLYINGTYFGLFQFEERPEASFGATYFGGNKDDYDAIKVNNGENRDIFDIEAADGTLDKWRELWQASMTGFASDALYFKVQGLNPDGTANPAYSKLLDVDNLIDYMLIIFYTGNADAPISGSGDNVFPNNFFAVYNRVKPDGFKFFLHDAEHSLIPGLGVDRTGPFNCGSIFLKSNPQWLHQKLSENPHYRLRFADRVYKHFYNGGALTLQNNVNRINGRKAQIETAIIAESARWGDSKTSTPLTKANWIQAINTITQSFFPSRMNTVLGQLKSKDLYLNNPAPTFDVQGGIVPKGYNLNIIGLTGTSKTYYTTDGSDPCNQFSVTSGYPAGTVSKSAVELNGPVIITKTTTVKARTLTVSTWSPLNEATFIVKEDLSPLKITELHYHPLDQDTVSDKSFEFIELKNCGSTDIQLNGASFTEGITYKFGDKTLAPGQFIVLASDKGQFSKRYGFMPYDSYSGQLDNSGEKITFLSASGDTVISFIYDDKLPWPEEADGTGYSLVSANYNGSGNPSDAAYWKKSAAVHGSPGKQDAATSVNEDAQNQVIKDFSISQNYPNPFNPSTTITYAIPKLSHVELKVYDMLGREISTLVSKVQSAGEYKVQFNGADLSSGIYVYIFKAENFRDSRKFIILK